MRARRWLFLFLVRALWFADSHLFAVFPFSGETETETDREKERVQGLWSLIRTLIPS